ncbi:MAG: cell division protein FtsL [Woeseiaceae bacterium]
MILAMVVLASSLGVVYAKHQSRKLFIELDTLKKDRDEINVQWGRLQLEQSTLVTHSRIEQTAKEKLKMVTPEYKDVLIVRP